jgi:uncharacterized protein with PIN domain
MIITDGMYPIDLDNSVCSVCGGNLVNIRAQSIIDKLHIIKRCVVCGREYYEEDILLSTAE